MTDPARFELFSFWRTSATYRVRVALNLKGVKAQEHNVVLDAGELHGAVAAAEAGQHARAGDLTA